ncbi:MAG: hypothetical protein RL129_132 [Actinomycetota bacterium]|jgi:hypothetical protein
MSDQYIPGTCNIGKDEVARRKRVAAIGGVATILGAISIINKYPNPGPRIWLFLPALVFAIGWIQSKKKFCLAYGFMGVFNFGKSGQMQKAISQDDQAADRTTAFSILGQAIVLAFAITGLIYFLPL